MNTSFSSRTRGYCAGVLAAAAYGSIPLFTIPLYRQGMEADSVLFWRYLLAVPFMALLMAGRHVSFRVSSARGAMVLALAGLLVALSSVTLFLSYNYIDVGIASTLLFLYPVLVALIMAAIFRERLGLFTWACLAGAILGIALLSRTSSGAVISISGAVLVFFSSLLYALYIVMINVTKLRDVPSLKVIFYVLLSGIVIFLATSLLRGNFSVPCGFSGWFNAVALAVLPTALSFWLTTMAIQLIGATKTAILGAFEPVTGVLVSVVAFGGILSPREIAGIVMILVSVTLITAGVPRWRRKKAG